MSIQKGISLFLLLLSILPTESRATAAYNCQQPFYSTCISGCPGSACRSRCTRSYCGNAVSPNGDLDIGQGVSPTSLSGLDRGFPVLYGPFFPSYGPDFQYLTSLLNELNRQKAEIDQFRGFAAASGDPVLIQLADAASNDVNQRISYLQSFAYNLFAQY